MENFTFRTITRFEDTEAYKESWQNLLKETPSFYPTMSCEWLSAWYLANKETIEDVFILLFFDMSGKMVAIVPLYSYRIKIFSFPLKVLSLMGARDQIMTDIICPLEHKLAIMNETIQILKKEFKKWDLFTFRRMDNAAVGTIYLERIVRKNNYPFNVESRLKIPFVAIEGDWESYYGNLKGRFRKEIRRKTKKLSELGTLRYSYHEAPLETEVFNNFLQLEDRGWKGNNGSSILKREHLRNLYSALTKTKKECFKMVNFSLHLDETLISSSLCFQSQDRLYVFKIAYDEVYGKYSPGLLLRLYELEYCFKQGVTKYDFSGTAQKWMKFFTNRSHFSMDIIIYQRHLSSLVRYLGYTKLKRLLLRFPSLEALFKSRLME